MSTPATDRARCTAVHHIRRWTYAADSVCCGPPVTSRSARSRTAVAPTSMAGAGLERHHVGHGDGASLLHLSLLDELFESGRKGGVAGVRVTGNGTLDDLRKVFPGY